MKLSLIKITIYSVVLLIAWCVLTAQRWLPSMWSKFALIKFLSRIKIATLGTKAPCLFLNFSNFLQAYFRFSVQNLTQRYSDIIKTVEIVRENWEVAYFYHENEATIFYAKWEGDLLLILYVENFLRFSSQWFRGTRQDAGEHWRSQTRSSTNSMNKLIQGCIITKIPSM